jgi:transcriptional regulator with XRE-family HTH domain
MTFGEKIKQRRLEKGFSIRELSRRLDVSAGYLSHLERNQTFVGLPSEENIIKISNLLELDMDEMIILADKIPSKITDEIKNQLQSGKSSKEIIELLKRERYEG